MDFVSAEVVAALGRLHQITRSPHFHLDDPISEEDAARFEAEHGIRLPEDYREFLTHVGNGGAGPCGGVFPLGAMDDGFKFQKWAEKDGFVGKLSSAFPLIEAWNEVPAAPDEALAEADADEYDRQMEAASDLYWSSDQVNGAIPICHLGCAIRIWLVVTGPQRGLLWRDGRAEYTGLSPVQLKDGRRATFASWYMEWLNDQLQGLAENDEAIP